MTVNNSVVGPAEGVSYSRILSLNVGDIVTLRNVGFSAGEMGVGAGITIVRIGES